jgi:hypothetical protein
MVHIRTVILLTIAVLLIWMTLRSLRAQRLKERYVLLFLITGLPFLILGCWPDGILWLSNKLEIEKPTLMILGVATYFVLTTFELLSIVSVQERKIDTLGQLVGIMLEERRHKSGSENRSLNPLSDITAIPDDASSRSTGPRSGDTSSN